MTPRLKVQDKDYSPEDVEIWLTVCPGIRHLLTWAQYSDRHDANLMLWRVEHVYYNEWERREDLRDTWITPQGWWHPL